MSVFSNILELILLCRIKMSYYINNGIIWIITFLTERAYLIKCISKSHRSNLCLSFIAAD